MTRHQLLLDRQALNALIVELRIDPQRYGIVDHAEPGMVRMRLPFHRRLLRMGGTISGPTLMGLADRTMYILVQSVVGRMVDAVTTSLHIDFLARPAPTDLIAEARLLRLGSRLVVGDVMLFSEGREDPVARAGVTYALPNRDSANAD